MYVAFLLFVLSDAMNPVKRTFCFEHWYIVYFHDIQLWERKRRTGGASDPTVFSNLVAGVRRMAGSSIGATVSSYASNDAQVVEVIDRVVELAKVDLKLPYLFLFKRCVLTQPLAAQEYWFLLDHYSLTAAFDGSAMDANIQKQIKLYVNWLPMNPATNTVGKMLLQHVGARDSTNDDVWLVCPQGLCLIS